MAGLLTRLATGAAQASAREHIGPAATNISPRRPFRHMLDMREPGDDRAQAQLESFRGSIYAAVDKIGRRIAQLPIRLRQIEIVGDKEQEEMLRYHPFTSLLGSGRGKPHEEYSRWELDYWTQVSLDLSGEGWWLVERDRYGTPARVTPLPSHRMTIVYSEDTGLTAGYLFHPKGTSQFLGAIFIPKLPWDTLQQPEHLTTPFITYFRYPSPTGIEDPRGWSPVKAAAYSYDINLYEHVYKRNFLQQGAQLGGILQSEVALSKEQIEEYLSQFEARHRGPSKAGLPIVLPKMLKWHTTEPTPRDLQWVETVKATSSDIYEIYGISDSKLGRADIGNRATADAMDVTFNREVIQSRLDLKSSKIDADFLPVYPGQDDTLYFQSFFDDPVPEDREYVLRQERQDAMLNIRTKNEMRKKRGIDPMGKIGDMLVVKKNDLLIDINSADPAKDSIEQQKATQKVEKPEDKKKEVGSAKE